jgi:hypothetical protein
MTGNVVYVGIGNSDDKLSQKKWHEFIQEIDMACDEAGSVVGAWFSPPVSPYQNACFAVGGIKPSRRAWLRLSLIVLAGKYGQDSISYVEGETVLLRPTNNEPDYYGPDGAPDPGVL